MLLSIITVVKNNAPGLRSTGRSLLIQQNPPSFEWIIIDGGSTDHTRAIVTEFAELNPILISEPDEGIYDAMNKGMALSRGEYLWFLNGGDCLSDAFTLKDVVREITVYFKPDFLYGDAREDGRIKKGKPFHAIKRGQVTHHQAMIYRRLSIGDARYDTTYKIAADYAFTLDVAGRTQRIHYYPRVLCDYQAGGVSQKSALTGRQENYAIRQKLLKMNPALNRFYFWRDGFTFWLRRNYPKLFWLLR